MKCTQRLHVACHGFETAVSAAAVAFHSSAPAQGVSAGGAELKVRTGWHSPLLRSVQRLEQRCYAGSVRAVMPETYHTVSRLLCPASLYTLTTANCLCIQYTAWEPTCSTGCRPDGPPGAWQTHAGT